MILDVRGAFTRYYGKSHVLQGVSLHVGDGETGHAARAQRRGQDRPRSRASRASSRRSGGSVSLQGRRTCRAAAAPDRRARRVPRARASRHLQAADGGGEPAARRSASDSPWQLADIYRIFPRLKERRTQRRRAAFRRRAADAGDRPRADERPAPADARRAGRRARAGDRRGDRRAAQDSSRRPASRSCWSSRTSRSARSSPTATTSSNRARSSTRRQRRLRRRRRDQGPLSRRRPGLRPAPTFNHEKHLIASFMNRSAARHAICASTAQRCGTR